LQTEVLHVLDI